VRTVSHKLLTPVARIRFGLDINKDNAGNDPFVIKRLTGMDSDIQELDELIDEILTHARLEEVGRSIVGRDELLGKILALCGQSVTKSSVSH
jgi:signal transduction histidine kinase